ncbi:MAG TPA: pilus (MSHA type) biogenesis protein MshL [Syntrophorhabdaceae bacterium]|nr:pilus (MSHA type) biogenesis protein MshL [Syntrophorhabdaceae bacterium]
MVENRIALKAFSLLFGVQLVLISCTTIPANTKKEVRIPEEYHQQVSQPQKEQIKPSPPATPDFMPAAEDASPLRTRIVDIVARKTPLRDVLLVIANATNLNLVMEKGVDPETEVNLVLKNVTAESALNTVFTAIDYFYSIEENLLVVKAAETKMFELGHPPVIQAYEVDVGGDILGGAMNISPSGAGGGSSALKGNIAQSVKSDEAALKFWDSVEKSLGSILGQQTVGTAQSFTVNRLTGTVHVTGSKKELKRIEDYLRTVRKVAGRQVLIEAKVIEVKLQDDLQFGIDWTMVDRYLTTMTNGAKRVSSTFTYNTTNFANIVSSSGPLFSMTGELNFGGSKTDLSFVLNALQQQGDIRTLSNPKLNIMNGQTAMLSVGRNQAYISKVETTMSGVGTVSPTITYTVTTNSILSGTMIGIVPYISENGEISLTVTPIISDLVKLTPQTIGTTTTSAVVDIQLPTVDLREMSTTVKLRNGDIIAIGGLISKKEAVVDSQVPFLGSIPYLGYLFKSRDKQDQKTELVILIQPTLVNM